MTQLILASQSTVRQQMLRAAGVPFLAKSPEVDEETLKSALRANDYTSAQRALALSEAKALSLSAVNPEKLILGCDQTLQCADGTHFDKPLTVAILRRQLTALSGKTHTLFSAAAIARDGRIIWTHVTSCELTMRILSSQFIEQYCEKADEALLNSLGGYHIEAAGAQLFERLDGDYHAILGLPLLPLLDFLRFQALLPS